MASPTEAKAMETLRRLGGYSRILSSIIERMLTREAGNPRFQLVAAAFQKLIVDKIPRMREALQEVLGNQSWALRTRHEGSGSIKTFRTAPVRGPLRQGTHFEVVLKDKTIGWKGRVDIITVLDSSCILVDLKTGTPSGDHVEQLRVYSVLWDGDRDLNPNRLPVSELSLSYGIKLVTVSIPTEDEIGDLRDKLKKRTLQIKEEMEREYVVAKPSKDNCQFCQVKLLCDDYWRSPVRDEQNQFRDLELKLKSPRGDGDSIWIAQIIQPRGDAVEEVAIKRSSHGIPFWGSFKPDMRVRLTDAYYTSRQDELPLVNAAAFSEVLMLDG